ncbi:MAG: efflux RND transporter periplasmic adaptor subunit [Acidobacteriota bacterium]|nr:efflux RND transporter periplasmic adaptor subunit [Acidobacteriota bacterium]
MKRTTFSAGLLLLSLAAIGCTKQQVKEADPVVPVQVTDVKRDSIQRIITAEGILRAKDQAGIMPKITAPVKQFYVNRGSHVKKGQLLAVLENRDLAAAVVDAKGAYDQAAAGYRNTASATVPDEAVKAQQDMQAAKQAMEAGQKLLQSREQLLREGALARRLVDEAAVTYAQAKSQYETAQKHLESLQSVGSREVVKGAQGQMESARGKFQGAEAQLSYAEIRSPISGVVTDRPVFAGEMAAVGTPVITVMDVSRVIARANVPVAQAAYLHVGQPATMAETDAAIEVPARVTVVSPAVDPNSTTVEIWVEAANPGERLRPGVTVKLSVVAETIKDAIVIPPEAVLPSQEGGSIAMVVGADSTAKERKIEIGVRESDKVQILKGLQPGEKVVTVGGLGLADGAKVTVGGKEEKP